MRNSNTGNRLWTGSETVEKNNELYLKVANGDMAARDEMIRSNMGLVTWKVSQFLVFLPRLRYFNDDLVSSGMIGLVEAVNKMQAHGFIPGTKPSGLMVACIQSAIGHAVEHAADVRIPTRTRKRKEKKGTHVKAPFKEMTLSLNGCEEEDDLAFSYDPQPMQELRETIDACCEDDMEREIIRLREEGYVDREIGEMLSIPLTTIYVMRRTIYARFLELSGLKGEA